jgi:O-antigen biosynthesis protein
MPRVSIIVPTYNRPELLQRALSSIARQSYRDFEVVVANDAGCDLEPYLESFESQFKLIYCIASVNSGLAATRNLALSRASGELIAYLDDDDLFLPDHLEALVGFFDQVPEQVVYADAYRSSYYRDENGSLKLIKRKVPFSKSYSKDRLLFENLAPVNCFLHHRFCLEKVNGFDTGLYTHEDWDFWIRMGIQYPFAHLQRVTSDVSYIYGGGSMTATRQLSFEHTRLLLIKKYRQHAENPAKFQEEEQALRQAMMQRFYPAFKHFKALSNDPLFEFFDFLIKQENKLTADLCSELVRYHRLTQRLPWAIQWLKLKLWVLRLFKTKYRFRTIFDQ